MTAEAKQDNLPVCSLLKQHFGTMPLHDLVTATRKFPSTARVDLQSAFDEFFTKEFQSRLVGIHGRHEAYETMKFSHLLVESENSVLIGPLQFDEVEIGEKVPARCLNNALWLCEKGGNKFCVLLATAVQFGRPGGVHLEIAVGPGEAGLELSRWILDEIERKVSQAGSYRGKVLSLEVSDNYSGRSEGIKVHKLRAVSRSEIVLPEKTLTLLERNVIQFVAQREKLRELKMAVKKGLLFYGPPGTGKTHTIHYLASQMQDHTTLLITADQVGLLDEYMKLARFLQPAMVIMEDVDLIARARTSMRNPCDESLLNRLLNEMDGLREDAMIFFILTTNHPEQLEAALSARPGRVDQAIEFPLPDEEGRRKLLKLYARGLEVSNDLVEIIVHKTKNASAAFIKELMRRSAQYLIQSPQSGGLKQEHLEAELDEMLFSGGSLNVKLLGGSVNR